MTSKIPETRTAEPATRTPMLQIHLGCEFLYDAAEGVEIVAVVEPLGAGGWATRVRSERLIEPRVPVRDYQDLFDNHCWRLTAPGGELLLRYDALFLVPAAPDFVDPAAVQEPVSELPDDVLVYTLPSRFCQSDLLMDDAWMLFGDTVPGHARVQAICDWVHTNIEYGYGASGPSVSAVDTYNARAGVCRDFAHLPVTFCRALNIPARYVFGYLPDYGIEPPDVPMDFHAWFEAFLAGRWYTFDARHNMPRIGRVKIAHGRDAVDVAMVTSYGNAQLQRMTVWTDAEPIAAQD
ncbi:MAG: transglutaminase-like domain-containing protein [Dehalococcoidia bacterium]